MADKQVNIIVKAVDAVTGELRNMGNAVSSFGDRVSSIFKFISASIIGGAFGKFFKDSIKEALDA